MKIKLLFTAMLMAVCVASMAQVRVQVAAGYVMPNDDLGEATDGGFGYAINARYAIMDKLEVGLEYDGNILVAVPTGDNIDIGVFTISGILAKAQYNFLDSKVTPYAALGLGFYTSKTPEITVSAGGVTEVLQEEQKATSFGLAPEVGFNLGGFGIGVKYVTAGDMAGIEGVKASFLKFFIGYTLRFG